MKYISILFATCFVLLWLKSFPSVQYRPDSARFYHFYKTELNSGFSFYQKNSRESLLTELTSFSEDRSNYGLDYYWSLNNWQYDNLKQESFKIRLGIGPVYTDGTSDSSEPNLHTTAEMDAFGANLLGEVIFSGRYFYEGKSFALVEAAGFGKIESLEIQSTGYRVNPLSSSLATRFEEKYRDNRLRYGIKTKAGWGMGKPDVVNHLSEAEYLLNYFYEDRLFTPDEKYGLAEKISQIKNNRRPGSNPEKEAEEIALYLNSRLFMTVPEQLANIWKYGEFAPRLDGNRFEVGPFFTYYNREPDFVYGGFLRYESNKFRNFHWSRIAKAELSYNRYKTRDWLRFETLLMFDYYRNLQSKFSFGLKYIPVIEVSDQYHKTPFQNVFTPVVEYYSQLSQKLRIEVALMYNITNHNDYFIQGPEFSLSVYRSRY